ncbi:hypothetical protein MLD38_026263 [Melastoma candidum]|uniref:Uncharacterized protein n=1 Tax=Melastoma candidum TaxID=119954 RepID=A0ACB9P361_9MYRT|nr:hypothetical protein MLD38_026263 [Melastoma candidum]
MGSKLSETVKGMLSLGAKIVQEGGWENIFKLRQILRVSLPGSKDSKNALQGLDTPIRKIKSANQSKNVKNPEQKLIEIHREDDYGFWFMGFLRYEKAYSNLEKAIKMANQMETTLGKV